MSQLGRLQRIATGFVYPVCLSFTQLSGLECSYVRSRSAPRVRRTQRRRAQHIGLARSPCQMRRDDDTPAYLRFPIPAYGYLGISSVLAIAAIGCVFELSSGKPQYGTVWTSVILSLSLPGFLATFWLALQKGRHESEQ